jgi:hypothetical protein
MLPQPPTHPAFPFDDQQLEESSSAPPPAPPAIPTHMDATVALSLIPSHDHQAVADPAHQVLAPLTAAPIPEPTPEPIAEPPLRASADATEPASEPPAESIVGLPRQAPAELVHEPPPPEVAIQYSGRAWHGVTIAAMLLIAAVAGFWYGTSTRLVTPPKPPPVAEAVRQDPAPTSVHTPVPAPPPARPKPLPATVPPALVLQAEPDVPPGIRARIEQPVVINVDVRIDATGKVSAAKAQGDGDVVYRFLAERATLAAQSSRFRPARAADGTHVPSAAILTFVFEPPRR